MQKSPLPYQVKHDERDRAENPEGYEDHSAKH